MTPGSTVSRAVGVFLAGALLTLVAFMFDASPLFVPGLAFVVIGLAAPFLDLLLGVGDRISRIAEPQDYEYYPVRADELAGDERRGATGD